MSWFDEDTNEAPTGAQTEAAETDTPTQEGEGSETAETADLTGKPDWMPNNFWIPPAEDGTADYQAMAERVVKSYKNAQSKISEQGDKLAKHVVPDSISPYLEGIDKSTLINANERSGMDDAQIDQFMAQARSAGVGPGPAQTLMQSWMKSRHEATPEPKDDSVLRENAIAELNAAGRPGSEMAKRVQSWGKGLLREEKISAKQAEALAQLATTPHGIEVLHSLMGQGPAPTVDSGKGPTRAAASVIEDIERQMEDPKFGVDPVYTGQVEARMRAHESILATKYRAVGPGG